MVGRRYRLYPGADGIQRDSTSTNCSMSFWNSAVSKSGSATRARERCIRAMFMSGRNRRGLPSGPRYAFIPSNKLVEYWKHELAGSSENGP